jgi:hypothetical protein
MRKLSILCALATLWGCAPLVVATDADSVTVRSNAAPVSPADSIAGDYCRDMGMHAELRRLNPDGTATYNCRPGVWRRSYFDPRID